MMKSIFTIAILALPISGFAAEGAGGGSQFFYQADSAQQVVTPEFSYVFGATKYAGGSENKLSGFTLGAEYEYGVMPEVSVGGRISYVDNKIKADTGSDLKVSGLNDLEFFAKAQFEMGAGTFKYGAVLSISPGDNETKSNGDINQYSGRHTLEPYVGYQMNMDANVFGAKLATEIALTDVTNKNPNGETKSSGDESTTVSVFYENKINTDMAIGASFDWITTTDTKDETNGGTTEAMSPTQNLSVYAPMSMGTGTLIPKLAYTFTTDDKASGSDIDKFSYMTVRADYRMEF